MQHYHVPNPSCHVLWIQLTSGVQLTQYTQLQSSSCNGLLFGAECFNGEYGCVFYNIISGLRKQTMRQTKKKSIYLSFGEMHTSAIRGGERRGTAQQFGEGEGGVSPC